MLVGVHRMSASQVFQRLRYPRKTVDARPALARALLTQVPDDAGGRPQPAARDPEPMDDAGAGLAPYGANEAGVRIVECSPAEVIQPPW